MLVILFRSRLTEEAGDDYQDMAAEMRAYAKTQPGYVDFKSYQAEDGERISVVKWKDRETLEAWRQNARHREPRRVGVSAGMRPTTSKSPKSSTRNSSIGRRPRALRSYSSSAL